MCAAHSNHCPYSGAPVLAAPLSGWRSAIVTLTKQNRKPRFARRTRQSHRELGGSVNPISQPTDDNDLFPTKIGQTFTIYSKGKAEDCLLINCYEYP